MPLGEQSSQPFRLSRSVERYNSRQNDGVGDAMRNSMYPAEHMANGVSKRATRGPHRVTCKMSPTKCGAGSTQAVIQILYSDRQCRKQNLSSDSSKGVTNWIRL